MSIQSEITRISNNVQNTIDVIEQTGVSVPAGANSDNLPSLAQALANEKQDKLTGSQGQFVGFTADNVVGAVNAPAGTMIVNVTTTGELVTADKTVAEIHEAVSKGATVVAFLNSELYFQLGAIYGSSVVFISTTLQNKALISLTWSDPSAVVPNSVEIPTKASDLSFAKAGTGLNSGNVQDAIEEVNEKIPAKPIYRTVTLTASGWSSNTQTVTVSGVLADETAQLIQPMPAVASQNAYISAGVICSGQGANHLAFTCSTTPTEDISLYVVLTEVSA